MLVSNRVSRNVSAKGKTRLLMKRRSSSATLQDGAFATAVVSLNLVEIGTLYYTSHSLHKSLNDQSTRKKR